MPDYHRFTFWVGCRHDGEDESADVECLTRMKQAFEDLQVELAKLEKCIQDFFYAIQNPGFDLDAFFEVARQRSKDLSAKTELASDTSTVSVQT